MSADRQMFKKSPPGSVDGFGGLDPLNSPLSEMETLRMLLNERLTAAVDDILGVFGRTVARYREQIDCQKRQLEILRSGEDTWSGTPDPLQDSSWIKNCPEHQSLGDPVAQTDSPAETDVNTSVPQIKTEGSGEDCGGSAPHDHFDVAAHPEAEVNGQLLIEDSDTEDSDDNFGNIARLWKTEETAESIDQISDMEAKSSANLWQETDQLPPVFSCKVCGESFHRMSYLFTHTSSHLRDCGVCGKHLERTESLKLHLSVHREASFRCSVCGQSFTLRGNLRTHMRIHSGERPYACTVCSKSFGRKATLVRHVRSHTGEKPFTCTFCGHGFTEKGNLTVHLRTHTGERPYWCSNCNRRFSQLSSFYKHPCQRRGSASAPVNPS
ncbi:zinc finger protein 84-like isoform X2 [Melanotaenia boesemani]|uniref:zinc finger protein 84-like isoform X2 n=1 Tax=Melanotaenia boesemani TaxID=1250792 RepID=UPI001C0470C1|nr:zinc finger protein 84-like isoform X2 [Melanotaenia boesemani]